MPNHQKPTTEELEAQEKAAIEEAEKLAKNPPKEDEEEQDPPKDESSSTDASESNPKAQSELEDEANDEENKEEKQDEEDVEGEESSEEEDKEEEAEPSKELYKKKFSESSKENQKIHAKNRIINKAIQEAEEIPDPTEEEMQSVYGDDWDIMTDVDKELAKETIISKKWRAKIKEASDQATKIEKWNDSVVEFATDPKTLVDNPDLEGKTDEFIEFASQNENNNVPFKLLVKSFLYDKSIAKTNNKGKMFERPKGGANQKSELKNGKVSLDEARQIRETDYPRYKELVETNMIDYTI